MDDDVERDEPCPRCGAITLRQPCNECDDGFVDLYDEDPLWYDEDDIEPCAACHAMGNHWWCPSCGLDMHVVRMQLEEVTHG